MERTKLKKPQKKSKKTISKKLSKKLLFIIIPIVMVLAFGIFAILRFTVGNVPASNENGATVYVEENSLFTMNDGMKITGNSSVNGGGIYVSESGTFVMDGGTISENTATSGNGHNIYNAGEMTINGGMIGTSGNSQEGYGIYNTGTMTINGGTVYDNIYSNNTILTKNSVEINGTITLDHASFVEVEEFDGTTPNFQINISNSHALGTLLRFQGNESVTQIPNLENLTISGLDGEDEGIEVVEVSSEDGKKVWDVRLKNNFYWVNFIHGTDENNLFGDGTFETFTIGKNLNWGDNGAVASVSNEKVFFGNKALKIVGNSGGSAYFTLPVSVGKAYKVEMVVYSESAKNGIVSWWDPLGNTCSSDYTKPWKWQMVEFETGVISEATSAICSIHADAGQTIYIDQISIRDASSTDGALLMKVTNGQEIVSLPQPKRTGYFMSVQVGPDKQNIYSPYSSFSVQIDSKHYWNLSEDVTIETYWDTYTYRVNFDVNSNGEDVTFDSTDGLAYDSKNEQYCDMLTFDKKPDKFPVPEREEYQFNGWYVSGEQIASATGEVLSSVSVDGVTLTDENGKWKCAKEITVSASWVSIKYAIVLEAGSVDNESYLFDFDNFQARTLTIPTKDGHTFNGWKVSKTESGHTPEILGTTLVIPSGCYGDINITSNGFTVNTYQVSLNAKSNGGALSGLSQGYIYITYGTNTFKTGRNGTEFPYSISGSVVIPKATKANNNFLGWYSGNTLVISSNGQLVKNASGFTDSNGNWAKSDDVQLVAKFTPWTYTIVIDPGDATVSSLSCTANTGTSIKTAKSSITATYEQEGTFTIKMTHSGYTFSNWTGIITGNTLSSSETSISFSVASSSSSGATHTMKIKVNCKVSHGATLNLSANWTANSYTITLDSNGGNVYPKTISVTTGESVEDIIKDLPIPTRTGYNFINWKIVGNAKIFTYYDSYGNLCMNDTIDDYIGDGKWIYDGNVSLYAFWEAKIIHITLDSTENGSYLVSKKGTTDLYYRYGTTTAYETYSNETLSNAITKIVKPERTNYTFKGYLIEHYRTYVDEDGNIVENIFGYSDDTTIKAKWEGNPRTIYFNGNGGTPLEESKTLNYGEYANFSYVYQRSGYEFIGWYTSASGGTKLSNGLTTPVENVANYIENTHWIGPDNVTLYAHWAIVTYNITFEIINEDSVPENNFSLSKSTYQINTSSQTIVIFAKDASKGGSHSYSIAWVDSDSNVHASDSLLPTVNSTVITIPAGCYGDFKIIVK